MEWFAGVRGEHGVVVVAVHFCWGEGVVFVDGGEVVGCVRGETHVEA